MTLSTDKAETQVKRESEGPGEEGDRQRDEEMLREGPGEEGDRQRDEEMPPFDLAAARLEFGVESTETHMQDVAAGQPVAPPEPAIPLDTVVATERDEFQSFLDDCEKELEKMFEPATPSTVADEGMSASGAEDTVLEAAHAEGTVKANSTIWYRLVRAMAKDDELKQQYEQAKGRVSKDAIRKKWLSGSYEKYKETRITTTTKSRSDLEWGEFEPFEVMCGRESGTGITKTGILAAYNIAKTCLGLGSDWVRFNKFSKRMEFLRPRAGYKEKYEKMWQLRCVEQKVEPADVEAPVILGKGHLPEAEGGKKRPPTSNAGGPKAKPKAKPKALKTPPSGVSKKMLMAAQRSASAYCSALAMGESFLRTINVQESWQWARSVENSGELRQGLQALRDAVEADSFLENMITSSDIKDVKAKFSTATFEHEIEKVPDVLDPLVAAVSRQVNIIKKSKAVRDGA